MSQVEANKTNLPFLCYDHIPKLKINTGHLTISNDDDFSIVLLMQSENCYMVRYSCYHFDKLYRVFARQQPKTSDLKTQPAPKD